MKLTNNNRNAWTEEQSEGNLMEGNKGGGMKSTNNNRNA